MQKQLYRQTSKLFDRCVFDRRRNMKQKHGCLVENESCFITKRPCHPTAI